MRSEDESKFHDPRRALRDLAFYDAEVSENAMQPCDVSIDILASCQGFPTCLGHDAGDPAGRGGRSHVAGYGSAQNIFRSPHRKWETIAGGECAALGFDFRIIGALVNREGCQPLHDVSTVEIHQCIATREDLFEETRGHRIRHAAVSPARVDLAGVFSIERHDVCRTPPEGRLVENRDDQDVAFDLAGVEVVGQAGAASMPAYSDPCIAAVTHNVGPSAWPRIEI